VAIAADTFQAIGYPEGKVRYIVNRSDSAGALPPDDLVRAIGRNPDYLVPSDGRLVVASNNDGVPFVLAQPDAAISKAIVNIAADLIGAGRAPAMASRR
jgi:pilus assembly protein CpaE